MLHPREPEIIRRWRKFGTTGRKKDIPEAMGTTVETETTAEAAVLTEASTAAKPAVAVTAETTVLKSEMKIGNLMKYTTLTMLNRKAEVMVETVQPGTVTVRTAVKNADIFKVSCVSRYLTMISYFRTVEAVH